MWNPQRELYEDVFKLLQESGTSNNEVQKSIFNKLNEYTKRKDFINYLLHIFNNGSIDPKIRQVSGLTLKGLIERTYDQLNEDSLDYFKYNILSSYTDDREAIRRTSSNLINAFLKQSEVSVWPDILNFMINNLGNEKCSEMSLETLIMIIEDSSEYLEEKHSMHLVNLCEKVVEYINSFESANHVISNSRFVMVSLELIYILLENCIKTLFTQCVNITKVLLKYDSVNHVEIRFLVGKCWLALIKHDLKFFENYRDQVFNFYLSNLKVDDYKMNFNAAEFFLHLVEIETDNPNAATSPIGNLFGANLQFIANRLLSLLKLSQNDLISIESGENVMKKEEKDPTLDEEEFEIGENDGYNVNWTLRKCCSKLLDKMSFTFRNSLLKLINKQLEEGIQSKNWLIKESSILALGAIGIGSYDDLKPNLHLLVPYVINELVNPNKLIRAISCWTLSRFTRFILIDNLNENAENLFQEYLREILKRLTDKEEIVQEASCTSFSIMINVKKERVAPFLFDVFKIISNVFPLYKGTSLLSLYDIISLSVEEFEEYFMNEELIEDLVKCIIRRWYETPENEMKKIIPVFDILFEIIKASKTLMKNFINDFYSKSSKIISNNLDLYVQNSFNIAFMDIEVVCKSLELISIICRVLPEYISPKFEESDLMEMIYQLIDLHEKTINNYIFNLIGEFNNFPNSKTIQKNIEKIAFFLKLFITSPENFPDLSGKAENYTENKSIICTYNNCCWAIGSLSINFSNEISKIVDPCMNVLVKILSYPKLNKSLARNVSICIGRIGINNSEKISKYIDKFLKQFCLSLRSVADSTEKQEAFVGLCKSIYHNPNGVINSFAFFCDAVCNYETTNKELINMFTNLLISFKTTLQDKWPSYFKEFPTKLQVKMSTRFCL